MTLGAIVLGSLGYHTYSDFTSTVSSVEQKALDQINSAAASKTHEFEGRATKLENGFGQLENKLAELQTLPEQVKNLTNRLQHLEQIEIDAPNDVSSEKKSSLQKQIEQFRAYMAKIGYTIPGGNIGKKIDPSSSVTPYYDPTDNKIVIDQKLIDDPESMYRLYTHRALVIMNETVFNSGNKIISDIEYGLVAYMPCSYQGTSRYGRKFVRIYENILPADIVKLGYLYDVAKRFEVCFQGRSRLDRGEVG